MLQIFVDRMKHLGDVMAVSVSKYGDLHLRFPVPFATPDGDITLFITDWYTKSHKDLRGDLESGKGPGDWMHVYTTL
ncbi:hypothetical protein ACS0TY_022209 [Phlomoides rotata]